MVFKWARTFLILFVLSQHNKKVQKLSINGTGTDGVLGIQTQDRRMADTDESTVLWLQEYVDVRYTINRT